MIQIFHNPINDQTEFQPYFNVEATIDDLSESGLMEDELQVIWWTDEMDESQAISMNVCPQDIVDCYQGSIPGQNSDSEIKYYIEAFFYKNSKH